MVQDLISAMSSLQYLPFHDYEIIEKTVDEHRLQEFFWNFSYYVDVLCTVRDRIQADHGNTLFSTRRARAVHRRPQGKASAVLDRLVSEPLRNIGVPTMQLERARGSSLFGRYPVDGGDSAVPLVIPSAGKKICSRYPRGFDDHEAYVF